MAVSLQGPALFSTRNGKYAQRQDYAGMPAIIRERPEEDVEFLAERYQEGYPAICNRINTPITNVFDYFDRYDQHVQGIEFLRAVLGKIAEVNARPVLEYVERWMKVNKKAFGMLEPAHTIEHMFLPKDVEENGMDFTEKAYRIIRHKKNLETWGPIPISPQQQMLAQAPAYAPFPHNQPFPQERRGVSNPEQTVHPERPGPLRQIPPPLGQFDKPQIYYHQDRFTSDTAILEHRVPGATNRGDFHSDPVSNAMNPYRSDSMDSNSAYALPSRGLPGPFSYQTLPRVPLPDRLRNANYGQPRGRKNPAKRSSDDARRADMMSDGRRQSSNLGFPIQSGDVQQIQSPQFLQSPPALPQPACPPSQAFNRSPDDARNHRQTSYGQPSSARHPAGPQIPGSIGQQAYAGRQARQMNREISNPFAHQPQWSGHSYIPIPPGANHPAPPFPQQGHQQRYNPTMNMQYSNERNLYKPHDGEPNMTPDTTLDTGAPNTLATNTTSMRDGHKGGSFGATASPHKDRGYREGLKAYVGNIPLELTKVEIKEMLAPCAGLRHVTEPRVGNGNGVVPNYAYVFAEFHTQADALAAIELIPKTQFVQVPSGHFLQAAPPHTSRWASRSAVTNSPSVSPSKPGKGGQSKARQEGVPDGKKVQDPTRSVGSDTRPSSIPVKDVTTDTATLSHEEKKPEEDTINKKSKSPSLDTKPTLNDSDRKMEDPPENIANKKPESPSSTNKAMLNTLNNSPPSKAINSQHTSSMSFDQSSIRAKTDERGTVKVDGDKDPMQNPPLGYEDAALTLDPASKKLNPQSEPRTAGSKSRAPTTALSTPSKQSRKKNQKSRPSNKLQNEGEGEQSSSSKLQGENTKPKSAKKPQSENWKPLNKAVSQDRAAGAAEPRVPQTMPEPSSKTDFPALPEITGNLPVNTNDQHVSGPLKTEEHQANVQPPAENNLGQSNPPSGAHQEPKWNQGKTTGRPKIAVATPSVKPPHQKTTVADKPLSTPQEPTATSVDVNEPLEDDGDDDTHHQQPSESITKSTEVIETSSSKPMVAAQETSSSDVIAQSEKHKPQSQALTRDGSLSTAADEESRLINRESTAPTTYPQTERSSSVADEVNQAAIVSSSNVHKISQDTGVDPAQLSTKLQAGLDIGSFKDTTAGKDGEGDDDLIPRERTKPSTAVEGSESLPTQRSGASEDNVIIESQANPLSIENRPRDGHVVETIPPPVDTTPAIAPEQVIDQSAALETQQSISADSPSASAGDVQPLGIPSSSSTSQPAPTPEPILTRHKKNKKKKSKAKAVKSVAESSKSAADRSQPSNDATKIEGEDGKTTESPQSNSGNGSKTVPDSTNSGIIYKTPPNERKNLPKPETPYSSNEFKDVPTPSTIASNQDKQNRLTSDPSQDPANVGIKQVELEIPERTIEEQREIEETMREAGYTTSEGPSSARHFEVKDPILARLEGMLEKDAQQAHVASYLAQEDEDNADVGRNFTLADLANIAPSRETAKPSGSKMKVQTLTEKLEEISAAKVLVKASRGEREVGNSPLDLEILEASDLLNSSPDKRSSKPSKRESAEWEERVSEYIVKKSSAESTPPPTPTRASGAFRSPGTGNLHQRNQSFGSPLRGSTPESSSSAHRRNQSFGSPLRGSAPESRSNAGGENTPPLLDQDGSGYIASPENYSVLRSIAMRKLKAAKTGEQRQEVLEVLDILNIEEKQQCNDSPPAEETEGTKRKVSRRLSDGISKLLLCQTPNKSSTGDAKGVAESSSDARKHGQGSKASEATLKPGDIIEIMPSTDASAEKQTIIKQDDFTNEPEPNTAKTSPGTLVGDENAPTSRRHSGVSDNGSATGSHRDEAQYPELPRGRTNSVKSGKSVSPAPGGYAAAARRNSQLPAVSEDEKSKGEGSKEEGGKSNGKGKGDPWAVEGEEAWGKGKGGGNGKGGGKGKGKGKEKESG